MCMLHKDMNNLPRVTARDVNSREIAFPGRESQFPGLDRDSRFRPDDRPIFRTVGTFDVYSNAAVNSDLSCFLYRGRLKRPYLQCRADAVA